MKGQIYLKTPGGKLLTKLFCCFRDKASVSNSKLLLAMKTTLLFTLLFSTQVFAVGFSQQVSLNETKADLRNVLKEIKRQSGYSFVYNSEVISAAKPVSINIKDAQLVSALNSIFSNQPITYSLKEKVIVLRKKTLDVGLEKSGEMQQQIQVSGLVKDSKGLPVPAATIRSKATGRGTATNIGGGFILSVSPSDVLIVSSIGYSTREVPVNNQKSLTITLAEADSKLGEVVVTALGIKRQTKALSYNVQEVKGEEVTRVKDANFVNSLNGKVAGVTINSSATGVGGAARVVMRGAKSINGGNNVLYVVDGMPLANNSKGESTGGAFSSMAGGEGISDFNPEDIESISVLTGPSAAALYGSAAANGVILINTKKGTSGKLQLNFSNSTEFMSPFIVPEFQTSYGNKQGEFYSWGERLSEPSSYDPLDFFQTGTSVINALSMSVGNKQNQTFISLGSTNSKGIIPNNKYNRYNFSIRNTAKFLDDKMNVDLSAGYIRQEDQNMLAQGQYFNPLVPVYLFPRGEDFEKVKLFERYDPERRFPVQFWPYGDMNLSMQNPYWTTKRMLFPSKRDRFMLYGSAGYDVNSWLNITGRIRMDNTYGNAEKKYHASTIGLFAQPKGLYSLGKDEFKQIYSDVMLNLNKRLNDFSIEAHIGSSFEDKKHSISEVTGNLATVPNLFSFNNINPLEALLKETYGDNNERTVSAFASAEIGFRNYLYLTLTGRNDWSSKLVNSSQPDFFYPSVGLSAVISEMAKLPEAVSFLKVRGSYTVVGAPIKFLGFTPGTSTTPITGGGFTPNEFAGLPDFKAERTNSVEIGSNLRMFRNRLNIDVAVYQSNTYNQTFYSKKSNSESNSFYLQAGNVRNRGIEASLGFTNNAGPFNYATSLTYSLNENKIIELVHDYPDPITGEKITITEVYPSGGSRIQEAGQIGDVFVTGVLHEDNQGSIYTIEGDGLSIDNKTLKVGSANPDYTLGWRNSLGYKGVNLSFLLTGRVGGVVTSSTQAILDRYGVSKQSGIDRDNGGVEINKGRIDPRKYYELIGGGNDGLLSRYVYNATNFRLKEVSLSYMIPKYLIGNKMNLSVSLQGKNLWMIYNKAPYDPELTASTGTYSQGYDYFMQPSLRTFGFGIKAQF